MYAKNDAFTGEHCTCVHAYTLINKYQRSQHIEKNEDHDRVKTINV